MIGRVETFLRFIRRSVSRSEWLVRLLRLPVSAGTQAVPGLVMVQIDGLSHRELQRAFEAGEMPFLRRLAEREHYCLHRQYAGVPATTASFQAELFYGVKGAVPGFNFMERASGRLVRMFEPSAVARVERELATRGGVPLLAGGSAYADNYTGGAAESHFCPTAHGWGPSLRGAGWLTVAFLIAANAYSFLRTAVLLPVEVAVAVSDCIRGLIAGQDLVAELKFVPTRVAIAILLRELVVIGAKVDVARGLPIVHLNLLGYDEQSHRRGPASRFAHWSLQGIDDAVARIWRAAHRSARRHYDVWIYSDHGQEHATPYDVVYGRSLADAVAEVFAAHAGTPIVVRSNGPSGVQLHRVRLLGGRRIQRLFPVRSERDSATEEPRLTVAALGPVAMIYWQGELSPSERVGLARALVLQANVPVVLVKDGPDRVRGWSAAGEVSLPRDGVRVLGRDHPFLDEATRDLVALCHHPDAGDFVACGWSAGAPTCGFAMENGHHGGAGPAETGAFALLPGDAPLPARDRHYLRAADLRHAALALLGRCETSGVSGRRTRKGPADSLRLLTYNVHRCLGMDGKLSPERIARVIARYAPDVVALQELDVGRARSAGVDQAHRIAQCLEMDFHFHPALHLEEERYGDAILTHLPMRLVKAAVLPGPARLEPRGALWVAIDVGGVELQVINAHLGLLPGERRLQAHALLGEQWLEHPDCRPPAVLCGDFNALPSSPVCRLLRRRLKDAQSAFERRRPSGTFFGRFPAARIDYIFVDRGIEVVGVEVPDTELSRLASDHLPLIAELRLPCTPPAHDAATAAGAEPAPRRA
jgi:endonuclease/exonuclease/phosphatase family metal-dependent hydrolase